MTDKPTMQSNTDTPLARFTDYFVRNYPGPQTIIGDPHWHAPRIFRAAQHAIEASRPSPEVQTDGLVNKLQTALNEQSERIQDLEADKAQLERRNAELEEALTRADNRLDAARDMRLNSMIFVAMREAHEIIRKAISHSSEMASLNLKPGEDMTNGG